MLHVFFNVPLINSLSAKKKKKRAWQMKDHKLLTTACNCLTYTKPMEMVTRPLSSTSDGFGWRCTNQRCPKRHTYRTIRTGSFFEKSRVPLGKWLYKCISSTYGVTKPKREDGDPDVPVPP